MAKKIKVTKQQRINGVIMNVLTTLSDRVTSLSSRVDQLVEEAGRAWELNASRAAVVNTNNQKFEIAVNGLLNSVRNLREDSRNAADHVGKDFRELVVTTQKLNERMGKAESRTSEVLAFVKNGNDVAKFNEQRGNVLEAVVRAMTEFRVTGWDSIGEFQYIHPLDLADLINDVTLIEHQYDYDTILIDRVRYKQTPFVPRRAMGKFK